MPLYKATIDVLIEADAEDVNDVIGEALRPLLHLYDDQSALIDWQYITEPLPYDADENKDNFEHTS